MDAIRAEKLTKRFGGRVALDGLSLAVAGGELVGIVGPDGAGKTTALRILAGLVSPDSGEATVAGFRVDREPARVQDRIGYMSQRFGLYTDLTVEENLRFYADIYGVPRADFPKGAEELLGFSGLLPFRTRKAGNLSGGMKQKLSLACALIHTPQVLLLDEPTNGVDPSSRREFWRILYGLLKRGVAILVTTAYLDEAERCARVGLLHQGKLLALDTPDHLRRLVPGGIFEVSTKETRRAASALRQAFPKARVALFGDRVHIAAGEGISGDSTRAALGGAGVQAQSVRAIPPTLEDVFLDVVGRPEAEP